MSDSPELPPRPAPPSRFGDTVAAWLAWFGVGRLVVSAVCVLMVVGGVAWLVRTPARSAETDLPFAGPFGSTPPSATLAPPASAPPDSAPAPSPERLLVHMAGSVDRPGVYELDTGARVHAAIEAAGGPTAAADLDGLNLAATLSDGQRVYVPAGGEVDPASVPSAGVDPDAALGTTEPLGPIDLNEATPEQLEALPGIGPATAAAIVDDRDRHGPFSSVSDLERVPGIGPAKLAAVAELVTV